MDTLVTHLGPPCHPRWFTSHRHETCGVCLRISLSKCHPQSQNRQVTASEACLHASQETRRQHLLCHQLRQQVDASLVEYLCSQEQEQ